MMCICVAIMAASTFTFNIPVGLSILDKKDHPYLALGAMSGILSIPFGVFTSCLLMYFFHPTVRTEFATSGIPSYELHMDLGVVLLNLVPLIIFCIILAICLKLFPRIMVKGFVIFGRIILSVVTIITAAAIIEYYTGLFSSTVGWGFDPIFGDEEENFRAIELLGDDVDATITDHAGDIFNALGDKAAAREYWEKALTLDGDVDFDAIERKIASAR